MLEPKVNLSCRALIYNECKTQCWLSPGNKLIVVQYRSRVLKDELYRSLKIGYFNFIIIEKINYVILEVHFKTENF